MKGLSSLSSSQHSKNKKSGLTTIQDRFYSNNQNHNFIKLLTAEYQDSKYRSESLNFNKSNLPCAYHIGQKITNFCKNKNCLLPLCPKCIKIHSQQHQKMSIYGNFQTVQECLQQCSAQQNDNIAKLEQLVQIAQRMSLCHKQKMTICQQQLKKAKKELIDYIETIFQFYQEETTKLIISTSRQYQNQLIAYHKEIVTLLMNQKQMIRKYQNDNLKLQFLIDSYSRPNLNIILNNYAQRIQEITPRYVQISINTYELERIKVILKKYLDFGDFTQTVQNNLSHNLSYQRITLLETLSKQNQYQPTHQRNDSRSQIIHNQSMNSNLYSHRKDLSYDNQDQKKFVRSPIKNLFTDTGYENNYGLNKQDKYGFTQKGQIAKQIQQRLKKQSKLDNFKSPLQKFSLQRSRKQRVFLD